MMGFDIADILDPTASITESLQPNAKLVPDANGEYTRIVFLGDERERFRQYVKLMLTETKKFYAPLFRKHAKNKAAYEALGSKKEAIALTLVRSAVNQQVALIVNKFFSRAPTLLAGRALGDKKTEIIKPPVVDANGQQIEPAKPDTIDSQDEADAAANLINYKWLYRLPMRQVVTDCVMEAIQSGVFPSLAKVIATDGAPRSMTDNALMKVQTPVTEESPLGYKLVYATEQRTVEGMERIQNKAIPGERFGKAPGPESIDESEFCYLEYDEQRRVTRKRIAAGRYDFCLPAKKDRTPDEQMLFEKLAESVVRGRAHEPEAGGSRTASRPAREAHGETEAFQPTTTNTNYEFYTRWPILTEDEVKLAKKEKRDPNIFEMEVVSDFQWEAGEPLCCWELPWWSGTRPFVDWFMHKRPGSYSGNSTGEDGAPYQRYMSQLFHLQMQNLILQNQSAIFIQQDSPAWDEVKKTGRRVRPGFVYKINKPDDVQVKPLGAAVANLNEQITFLKSMAQELMLVNQWDNATASLTRVTSGAFQQQQNVAKMQPEMVYENFCEFVQRLALKDLQAYIQYAPDQFIPDFAVKAKAVIDNLLHLPRKMVTDAEIAFEVVATTDDETKANQLAQATQVAAEITKANQATVEGLGVIMKPGTPPQFLEKGLKLIGRQEKALGNILRHITPDFNDWIITEDDIRAMQISLADMAKQMQDQAAAQSAAQGGAPGAMPGGPQPAAPPGPPPPMAPQQIAAAAVQHPAAPPPQVKVNINLKGDLTPSQEAAAADAAGAHGDASAPSAAPPPPVPAKVGP